MPTRLYFVWRRAEGVISIPQTIVSAQIIGNALAYNFVLQPLIVAWYGRAV